MNNIINTFVPQEYTILEDVSSRNNKSRPWKEKKIKSELVAQSYDRLGNVRKSFKLRECGSFLEFKRFLSDDSLKLNKANFCKVRLCPLCSWRRSLKIFGQVSKVMDEAVKDSENQFLFLTLTVRNCNGSELPEVLNMMLKGYDYIFKRSKVKKSILGSFRALEITHNTDVNSESFDTYHPHFHCVLMVKKSYFNSRSDKYITQSEWSELWKHSIKADYKPIVHIQKIENSDKNIKKAVAETAKYSVKDSDILNENTELQDSAVKILDGALYSRRLISFRGEFSKIKQQLQLDDAIDGDLIHCDGTEELRQDLDFVIERYSWHVGYYQYIKIEKNEG